MAQQTITRRQAVAAGAALGLAAAFGLAVPALASEAPEGGDAEKGVAEGGDAATHDAVAEGLSDEDAAAVAEGKTVRIIDQYCTNLADATRYADQHGGGTVTLLADTVATDDPETTATIGFRTSVMIKSEGDEPLTVYRAEGQTGPMLKMTDGTVSLKNVTFDGAGEGVGAPAIEISDQAVVKFGKGLTVRGNASDGSADGSLPASAVSVSGKDASLTLKSGSAIRDNAGTGAVEAALYNDRATVVNEGCAFEGNASETGDNPDYAGDGKLKGDTIGA